MLFSFVWFGRNNLLYSYLISTRTLLSPFQRLYYYHISVYILNIVPFVYSIFFYFTFVGCVGGELTSLLLIVLLLDIFRTHLRGILVSFFSA